ncbi:hypothetical protein M9H77_12955 [Catharanthus roseus]|uniref:Uncharacterized protein n=1 Tax=Catharanthus roseus TaxID=4058 RepID=A0ACC0BIX1_CATRO|nr:hypothetical protein M9H77_12955 [Catharanthus roseus]
MEEVSAHVHPGPIVPDVLMRQHKYRSGLIWSRDHETCLTNLQCRRIGCNLFQSYSIAPCRLFVCLPYHERGLVPYNLWRAEEVDDMTLGVIQEPPSSPSQIASLAKNVQTIIRRCMVSVGSTLGYTPSQHDIQQTFPVQPSRRHPREPIPDRGARGLKRGAHKLPGGGARGGQPPAPPNLGRGHADPGRGGGMGEGFGGYGLGDLGCSYQVEPFNSPNLGTPSFFLGLMPPTQSRPSPHPPSIGSSLFQAPLALRIGSSSFQAPPPPYTIGSSTQHMPISKTSSSDSDEHDDEPTNVVTLAQQLRFGNLVGRRLPDSHHLIASKIAYGAYGPYFTGVVQKACTFPTNQMISHAQLTICTTHTRVQTINTTEYETAIKQMVSNEPSMLYTTVTDDDFEIDHSDSEYITSSQSESDNDAEEEDLQTPVIPITENTVTQ